jgi:hypothetical protein
MRAGVVVGFTAALLLSMPPCAATGVIILLLLLLLQSNGRFISDNRMRFLFGTSERGSLDKAMAALQAEVDAAGISEGLDRQQVSVPCCLFKAMLLAAHCFWWC